MSKVLPPQPRDSSEEQRTGYGYRLSNATSLILVAMLFVGCASHLSNGQRWGANATLRPGWERVGRAALNAALDARTLVPAAAAGVLAIGDLDDKLGDAAQRSTPIFGSRSTALSYSDAMRAALIAETIVTGLTAPSGSVDGDWSWAKLKGLSVEGAALGITAGATQLLQEGVGRTRPDGSNDRSFPSGHASTSFAAAALASNNLAAHRFAPWVQRTLEVANTAAASSVAWARVEGNKHFPTDAFFGAALGNFLGMFIHDAFLGVPEKDASYWSIVPTPGGAMLEIGWQY
jgi:membrane-associated phospholipid phosphatase